MHADPIGPGEAVRQWASRGLRWGEASQELLRCAADLALASRDLATLVIDHDPSPLPGLTGPERLQLSQRLKLLAPAIERQAAAQRDDYMAIAPALSDLHSLLN